MSLDPLVTSSLISTGGRLLGNFLGGGRSAGDQVRTWVDQTNYANAENYRYWTQQRAAEHQYQRQLDWDRYVYAKGLDDTQLQRRVADAKAAGLHPLYALGVSPGVGPSFSAGSSPAPVGQSSTGSYLGEGYGRSEHPLSSVLEGAAGYYEARARSKRQSRLDKANLRAAEARALRDEAEAAHAWSLVKRSEQRANETRTAPYKETQLKWHRLPGGMHREKPRTMRGKDGSKWIIQPGMRQEDVEEEYGEIVGGLYGTGKALLDFAHEYARRTRANSRRKQRAFRKKRHGGKSVMEKLW